MAGTNLYLAADCPRQVYIDYIMLRLTDGREVSVNWEESYIGWDDTGFAADYKRIHFDDSADDVPMEALEGAVIVGVGLYSEVVKEPSFKILATYFDDDATNHVPEISKEVKFYHESPNQT